ncbi:diaminopimelate epimerase [Desulfallas sp. Bu1-1]|uniref:diaminopimelate epimerase n=1 Tax=Desulfallas sp. Bu1-1 TaxID=2787620 RepID=UPI001FAB69D7|nr:diaminopimelate epimerase [Desulfallas sp. Bu1-1]
MRFTKVHGLGNDFVLVNADEERDLPGNLAGLAVKVCDRHFGVGADGLVLIKSSNKADIAMQIFNSDGSEAEMCGNAIRCVAKYAYERGLVKKTVLEVETGAGIMVPELVLESGVVRAVRVDMGAPRLEREQIPMHGPAGRVINEPLLVGDDVFYVTAVSMGNPHCVVFVPGVAEIPLDVLGPRIETHPAFPRKTNVEFVQVLSKDEVRMRVWERGAGPTMACGTGACATAVAAALNGHTGRKVRVHLYAGALDIEWAGNGHVYMTGPAEEVFTGDYVIKD